MSTRQTRLFPACASTRVWRQLHREQHSASSGAKKQSKQRRPKSRTEKGSEQETVLVTSSSHVNMDTAGVADQSRPSVLSSAYEPAVIRKRRHKASCRQKSDSSNQRKAGNQCNTKKAINNLQESNTSGNDRPTSDVDDTPCLFCEIRFCDSSVGWFMCARCRKWACGNCTGCGSFKKKHFLCGLC